MSQVTVTCCVCGKKFIAAHKSGPLPTVCSESCRGKRDKQKQWKDNTITAVCEYCGKGFTKIRSSRIVYCSTECRHKASRTLKGTQRECSICKKLFEPHTKGQKCCSRECADISRKKYSGKNYCKECGREYVRNSRNLGFCSALCAAKYNVRYRKQKDKTCVYCNKTFQGKGKYCSEECKEKQYIKDNTKICEHCGREFVSRSNNQIYCSDECRRSAHDNKAREKMKAVYVPKKVICRECGREFLTEYGNTRRDFCSDECSNKCGRRVAKATRRARIRGNNYEFFDPREVFARDNYTCQICGVKTPKSLRGTLDDYAPELDHIVPLALGGEHTRENTQCLCRKCNRNKGATPMEDYLRAM